MNQYEKLKQWVEAVKCKKCFGLGYISDADIGDIYANQWTCNECNGTGTISCVKSVEVTDNGYNHLKNLKEDELRDYIDTKLGNNSFIRFLLDNNLIRGMSHGSEEKSY